MKRIFRFIIIIFAVILLGIIYYFYNPAKSNLFLKCPFHLLTNLNCPGCGSQRAIHSLLHLEIVRAFKYNALMVCTIPFLVFLFFIDYNRNKYAGIYHKLNNKTAIIIYLLVISVWWVGRNIANV